MQIFPCEEPLCSYVLKLRNDRLCESRASGVYSGPDIRFWEVRQWTSSFRTIEGRVSDCEFPTDVQQ